MRQFSIADWRLPIRVTALVLVAFALGLFPAPLTGEAQQAGRVYRIGFLGATSASGYAPQVQAVPGEGFAISVTSKARTSSSSSDGPRGITHAFPT